MLSNALCTAAMILVCALHPVAQVEEPIEATAASPVDRGLAWLARHQHDDGYWSCRGFRRSCSGDSCAMLAPKNAYSEGEGWKQHDLGVTGLALLAFLADGAAEGGKHGKVVARARNWLLDQQIRSGQTHRGRIGPAASEQWIYGHAVATRALATMLSSGDTSRGLKKGVEEATLFCLRWQNPQYGWRYRYHDGNDTSVSAMMLLALSAARDCSKAGKLGIPAKKIEQHYAWGVNWLRRVTNTRGKSGYLAPGDSGSQLIGAYPTPFPFERLSATTAMALACRTDIGAATPDPALEKSFAILDGALPEWSVPGGKALSRVNMIYWYYGTYAMTRRGGESGTVWLDAVAKALHENQRVGGCEDGSWDPIGPWGVAGGRVYSTALGVMTSCLCGRR